MAVRCRGLGVDPVVRYLFLPDSDILNRIVSIFCLLPSGGFRLRKTSVEVDHSLIEQVRLLLGTASIKETIDAALREILRREARRQEIAALSSMEGLDLANETVMAKAWRR